MEVLIEKMKRQLKRLEQQKCAMEIQHKGNEEHRFTYWGGFELGYLKGKISVL